jgi:hypothetical protein
MMQRKKDEVYMFEEIKENYKNTIDKTKVSSRPPKMLSKYKEHINLYTESS